MPASGVASVAGFAIALVARPPEHRRIGHVIAATIPGMKTKEYNEQLGELEVELAKLQAWIKEKGLRIVVIFEGRDAAGKGGTIKTITRRLSPRVVRTVALPVPNDRQKTEWFLQRYVPHLPAAGEMVLFDRSWYNRLNVEKVMGFCTNGFSPCALRSNRPWSMMASR